MYAYLFLCQYLHYDFSNITWVEAAAHCCRLSQRGIMTFFYRYDKKAKTQSDGYFSDTSMTVNTTKTFDIEAVIDPKTQEELSAQEAVQRGIIDEATGGL